MPLATIHLIALSPTTSIAQYVSTLRSTTLQPLIVSRVVRWIIRPERLSSTVLLTTNWDLLVILPVDQKLDAHQLLLDPKLVARHWSLSAGIPKVLSQDFHARNQKLLHPEAPPPPLTGALASPRIAPSAQGLELTRELLHWSQAAPASRQPAVSMLNLLSFRAGADAHASYQRYGKAFAETIGKRRGGLAKLVGRVVPDQGSADEDRHGWDEFALAHYPSAAHFADMIASEDYQRVNHESRLPALRDTLILCTSEVGPELEGDVDGSGKAKL